MLPLRIEGATRRLAENQKEYIALSIKDATVGGIPVMLSRWELKPAEMDALEGGGELWVGILGGDGELHPALMRPVSAREIELLRMGAALTMVVPGKFHPPVCPTVAEKDEVSRLMRPAHDLVMMEVADPYE